MVSARIERNSGITEAIAQPIKAARRVGSITATANGASVSASENSIANDS